MNKSTCCFLGHRKIETTDQLITKLKNVIHKLIIEENIDTFLFGSKSQFNDLCYQIVSELKTKYPYIKRIYVRAQFPTITDEYKAYLLQSYEETYYPDNILKSGISTYVERNCEMINRSSFCVVYYDSKYMPPKRKRRKTDLNVYQPKSGTKIAYDYALKKQKKIINIFNEV